jgi:hypothetical protein
MLHHAPYQEGNSWDQVETGTTGHIVFGKENEYKKERNLRCHGNIVRDHIIETGPAN